MLATCLRSARVSGRPAVQASHDSLPLRSGYLTGLFAEASRLVWQSVLVADGKIEALNMMGDLGEVLRGSGNRRDAERVLRTALLQEDLPAAVGPTSMVLGGAAL